MASFHCDHIHFRAADVPPVVEFFEKMFDAEVFSEGEMDGYPFIRIKLGDVNLTISGPPKGVTDLHPTAGKVMSGIDHIAFGVDDLDAVAADLKARGAKFITAPTQSNPNLKISFIEGPVGIRVEILQRM
ncbi:MAG: VOC family protein [Nitrospinota bacterium]|jgi:lactoylglutathione lyase|nr:VOC family protein [Nitrospinota bacterium]